MYLQTTRLFSDLPEVELKTLRKEARILGDTIKKTTTANRPASIYIKLNIKITCKKKNPHKLSNL
ncbi:hypothetical protein VCHA53O466_40242 [Vibrio chagasii]|nr:hypothetical protein VCHA53O466_40242 [Vibrio chagasii]